MPFEDVALHALLLSGRTAVAETAHGSSDGGIGGGGGGDDGSAAGAAAATVTSPLTHKQRVAQLYAQSLAKRSEWASSLNVRSFAPGAGGLGSSSSSGSSRRTPGPKAPRSWDGMDLALGSSSSASSSSKLGARGGTLETIIAAAVETEAEAELGSSRSLASASAQSGRAAPIRNTVEAYDAHFLRPSPTSLSHADLRIGSASRLAAAAELQPEWRRSAGAGSERGSSDKGKAKEGTVDGNGTSSGLASVRAAERALIRRLAVRFRRLACVGSLDYFQQGTRPNDRLMIEYDLEAGLNSGRSGAPAPSLVDLCLVTLVEAYEPLESTSQPQRKAVTSRRRRRRATTTTRRLDDGDGSLHAPHIRASDAEEAQLIERQHQQEDHRFLQESLYNLPRHLKVRAAALVGRLACVESEHAADFLQNLLFGSTQRQGPSRTTSSNVALDDWEADEALTELSLDSVEQREDTAASAHRGGTSWTELDLSFVSLSPRSLDHFLGLSSVESRLSAGLRTLSLAGLNQHHMQAGSSGSSGTAQKDQRVSVTELIKVLRLLPALEVLSLAGSCLFDPAARSSTISRRGVIPQSTKACSSCDQVFAASLGDMLFDVSMEHPQALATWFICNLAKATPNMRVLDLSATCWTDEQVLKEVPWLTAPAAHGDKRLHHGIDPILDTSSNDQGSRTGWRTQAQTQGLWTVGQEAQARRATNTPADTATTGMSPGSGSLSEGADVTEGAQAREHPVWLRLERLLLRGCPHLITEQPPGPIIAEWSELTAMPYTRKRHLEQRRSIILSATQWKRASLSTTVRGQRHRTDPAIRWTEIVWDY
ncbi:hypothetical protein OC834_000177 [Tilletia horrida]|nr:hypothetical protein OC834_000177 [Tilletia horrida]